MSLSGFHPEWVETSAAQASDAIPERNELEAMKELGKHIFRFCSGKAPWMGDSRHILPRETVPDGNPTLMRNLLLFYGWILFTHI